MTRAAFLVWLLVEFHGGCGHWETPESPLWTVDLDSSSDAQWASNLDGTTAVAIARGSRATIGGRQCATPCIATIAPDGRVERIRTVADGKYPQAIGIDGEGNVVVDWDYQVIAKYDAATLANDWTQDLFARSLIVGEAGGIVYQQSRPDSFLSYPAMLAPDGTQLWQSDLWSAAVAVTSSGDVLVRLADINFLLLDGIDGHQVRTYSHGSRGTDLAVERDGFVVVLDEPANSDPAPDPVHAIAKLDMQSNPVWSRDDVPLSFEAGAEVEIAVDGDVLVSGITRPTIDPHYGVHPGFPAMALLDGDSGETLTVVERSSLDAFAPPDSQGYITSSRPHGFGDFVYSGLVKHALPRTR